jgi:histidyl-tRNA synthetase
MCMMAADCLEALGVKRGDYVIKVNNRKVLDGVMEAIGLGGAENAGRRLKVLRAIDKTDRLGARGVSQLLQAGRWDGGEDGKGDFTSGAGLNQEQQERILWYIGGANPDARHLQVGYGFDPEYQPAGHVSDKGLFELKNTDRIERLTGVAPNNQLLREGLEELRIMSELVSAAGYDEHRIGIDPAVVRGLEYYTGPVFEAELNFAVKDEAGRPVRFGSVGGGGRYDGLVARFRSEPVPATGFSIGVSRLLAALRAINSPIVAEAVQPGPVVVLVLDRDRIADYQRLVAVLRGAGIASELYLGAAGMNAQLKYADRRRSLCAVIQGSNERGAPGGPQVVVRDLALGAELAKASKDRSDYLEMRQRAQIAAPEAELVTRVREVLARGGAPLLAP